MIEVFKTNVQTQERAQIVLSMLAGTFPSFKINFDLDDTDKILKVQGENIRAELITGLLKEKGYQCEVLA
jgi:hypothetical protein